MSGNVKRSYDIPVVVGLLLIVSVGVCVAWFIGGASPSAAFNARIQIVLTGVTAAAAIVALWYAYLTRQLAKTAQRQAASAEQQMEATERQLAVAERQLEAGSQQLALMNQEMHDTRLARLQDNKPVVFTDIDHGQLVMRNVGAGLAVNVFLVVDVNGQRKVIPFGAIAAAQQILITDHAAHWIQGTTDHLVIAEGVPTRTRRWNPTMNWHTGQSTFAHHLAYPAEIGGQKAREENDLSIGAYVAAHAGTLFEKLSQVREGGQ